MRGGDRQPRSEPFGQLTIERRVLIVPGSTTAIASIATVSTGSVRQLRKVPLGLAVVLLVGGLALVAAGLHEKSALTLGLGGASQLGGLVLAGFFARAERFCLSVVSAGGQRFLFAGQRKTLEEARRLLTDKINSGDESAVYRINFEKGIVHAVGQEPVGAAVPGLGPLPLSPLSPLSPGPLAPGLHPVAGNGRIAGFDLGLPGASAHATGVPGPQLSNGHHAGASLGPSAHIDYAVVLPQIVDMQRFYAQRQDTQDIAERLNEMEFLMRSGTPTAAGRGRLGQLAGELSTILGAYPSVVHIFQQSARLAGV